jgi:RHS repeat-associated protein
VTKQYLLGTSGEQVTELDGAGTWKHSNVYTAGKLLATFDNLGLHYQLTDWLGTKHIQASATGAAEQTCISLPFGNGPDCSGAATEQRFTGKERDAESGNDYFGARYYASTTGRWMSPDPINLTNARLMNPANTLNKYAYGANNPLKYVDPDGKDITIYYRAPTGGVTDFGHVMLGVLNQNSGKTAFIDFYPKGGTDSLGRGPGTFNPGDMSERGTQNADGKFASLTIQTNPEQAQALIDAITKMENGQAPDYSAFLGTNCTTLIEDTLKDLGLDFGDQSPSSYWADLFATQSSASWADRTIAAFTQSAPHAAQDYGRPRYNNQSQLMFQLYWLQMHPDQDNSRVTTSQGPATPCGGNTGHPCQ